MLILHNGLSMHVQTTIISFKLSVIRVKMYVHRTKSMMHIELTNTEHLQMSACLLTQANHIIYPSEA